jgi:hypothetical protein
MTLRCKLRYFPMDWADTKADLDPCMAPDIEIDAVLKTNTVIVPDFPQANFQPGDYLAREIDDRVDALKVIGPARSVRNPDGPGIVWLIPVMRGSPA